jgi:hypothetical protein
MRFSAIYRTQILVYINDSSIYICDLNIYINEINIYIWNSDIYINYQVEKQQKREKKQSGKIKIYERKFMNSV